MAPNVNSYKRFQPGSWAPTAVGWDVDNRTLGFRVVGHGDGMRVENRVPGADANTYHAFAAAIAGGLHGIEQRIEPPAAYTANGYTATDLPRIPSTFVEAIELWREQRRRQGRLRRRRPPPRAAPRRGRVGRLQPRRHRLGAPALLRAHLNCWPAADLGGDRPGIRDGGAGTHRPDGGCRRCGNVAAPAAMREADLRRPARFVRRVVVRRMRSAVQRAHGQRLRRSGPCRRPRPVCRTRQLRAGARRSRTPQHLRRQAGPAARRHQRVVARRRRGRHRRRAVRGARRLRAVWVAFRLGAAGLTGWTGGTFVSIYLFAHRPAARPVHDHRLRRLGPRQRGDRRGAHRSAEGDRAGHLRVGHRRLLPQPGDDVRPARRPRRRHGDRLRWRGRTRSSSTPHPG